MFFYWVLQGLACFWEVGVFWIALLFLSFFFTLLLIQIWLEESFHSRLYAAWDCVRFSSWYGFSLVWKVLKLHVLNFVNFLLLRLIINQSCGCSGKILIESDFTLLFNSLFSDIRVNSILFRPFDFVQWNFSRYATKNFRSFLSVDREKRFIIFIRYDEFLWISIVYSLQQIHVNFV